jgi:hypothetical protein|tara:strand:+ start:21935 stop:22261 length:327 start_codon:yes stop_codon:yes gene_type:complete
LLFLENSLSRHRLVTVSQTLGNLVTDDAVLAESAWSYRFPARQTGHLKRKAFNDQSYCLGDPEAPVWTLSGSNPGGKEHQARVCRRGARADGFIWDIICQVMPSAHAV